MDIFLIVISYILAISLGCMLAWIFLYFIMKSRNYSGTMKVIRDEDKVLYSLELEEDPIMLEHRNEVIFKVQTSDQSSDRKQN
jgi:hypothetical protein